MATENNEKRPMTREYAELSFRTAYLAVLLGMEDEIRKAAWSLTEEFYHALRVMAASIYTEKYIAFVEKAAIEDFERGWPELQKLQSLVDSKHDL